MRDFDVTLMSIRLGTNDLDKARRFYDATFAALEVGPSSVPSNIPLLRYLPEAGPPLLVGPARDGNPATAANGGTLLFAAKSEEMVRQWHAAGLAAGGSDAGIPEPKPQARNAFGAYLKDPDGNKLGCYFGLSL